MSTVVGVDLGGTKVAAARLRGWTLGDSVVHPTSLSDTATLIEELAAVVEDAASDPLDAVGIGVPSIVEFDTGRVLSSVNVPLADVPLRQVLSERLGVPVFVDNDATVAALAEAHDDELRPIARNLVMLTVGTGIGGGLVLDGRIYRGSTGGAGELGQTIVGMDMRGAVPDPGDFPQRGSLEYEAAGHALDRMATEAAGRPLLGADCVQAAHEGDEIALRTIEIWAERLGVGIANAINTFDPDEVVIGGGGALAGDLLLEPATRVAQGYVVPGLRGRTVVRLARHGIRAGVLGAAMLAVHELDVSRARVGAAATTTTDEEVEG